MQPSWHLTVAGSGKLVGPLSHLASSLGASVTWIEHQADVAPYLAKANIAVVPSLTEGWGLAAIEAAAAGLPIVMTDVGCAGELLVDGESALVVPPNDSNALSAAIARLASDFGLRQRLG
jgi:glycosyltransferase involved in cell wall biosynthesis